MDVVYQIIDGLLVACSIYAAFVIFSALVDAYEKIEKKLTGFQRIASIAAIIIGIAGLPSARTIYDNASTITKISFFVFLVPIGLLTFFILICFRDKDDER